MADVASLQSQYPGYNIVDAIDAPGGGVWAIGSDGGVFALDGAPFFGSYWSLRSEDRQGDRTFVAIQPNAETGGYQLISSRGEVYAAEFGDPNYQKPAGPGTPAALPPAPSAPPPPDPALGEVEAILNRYGLGELVTGAWAKYKETGGSMAAVETWLPTTAAYKTRFPGLEATAAMPGGAWTPAQYLQYEERAYTAAGRAGLPAGFVDRDDIGALVTGGVSIVELEDRISTAGDAALTTDPATLAALTSMYGIKPGDLTAYFLNPDKATPFIERKFRYENAQIGGAATRSGFGALTAGEAAGLNQNLTVEQATRGLGEAAAIAPIFSETAGETMAGDNLGRTDQLGFAAGEQPATSAVERRRKSRQAAFGGGGGAAQGGAGTSGLGTAR